MTMSEMEAGTTTVKYDKVPALEYPSARRKDVKREQCLIYMIPGNPGLIAYYDPFMKALRQLLDEREADEGRRYAFHIYGRNLLGFTDEDHEPLFGTTTSPGTKTEPFSLEDQIRAACEGVQQATNSTLENNRAFDQVILIGHSVGSYITLEIFHRHHLARLQHQPQQHQHQHHPQTQPPTPTSHPQELSTLPLKSAILLFPTISHIAQSPSGRKLNLLQHYPVLDRAAHHVAKGLVDLVPAWLRGTIVRNLMGFPEHAAVATLRFLESRDGIWQALHMGKDEMRTIRGERWVEEMWEVQEVEEELEGKKEALDKSKFFFFFAEKDHWVADECRDEFIERRERHEKGRTRIVVDEAGIPHAFCIHHSETVAEKVHVWIGDIAGL